MSFILNTRPLVIAVAMCALVAAPARVAAQSADSVLHPVAAKPLFRRADVVFLGSAVGVAALTSFADRSFATELREPGPTRTSWHAVTQLGTSVGDVGPLVFTLALWSGGGIAHRRKWEALGREGAEAFLVAGSATTLLKGVVGRERPSASANDADIYVLGHGFGNNAFSSFPSGHTSVAFAVATVMAVGTADESPLVHRSVSVLAYGVATSVGLSRLYNNKHWASDVVGGAALGITSGLVAVRFDHRPRNGGHALTLNSVLDHVSISPAPEHGVALGFHSR